MVALGSHLLHWAVLGWATPWSVFTSPPGVCAVHPSAVSQETSAPCKLQGADPAWISGRLLSHCPNSCSQIKTQCSAEDSAQGLAPSYIPALFKFFETGFCQIVKLLNCPGWLKPGILLPRSPRLLGLQACTTPLCSGHLDWMHVFAVSLLEGSLFQAKYQGMDGAGNACRSRV